MNRRRFLQAAALSAAAPSILPNALAAPKFIWTVDWYDFRPTDQFLAYDAKVRHLATRAAGFPSSAQ